MSTATTPDRRDPASRTSTRGAGAVGGTRTPVIEPTRPKPGPGTGSRRSRRRTSDPVSYRGRRISTGRSTRDGTLSAAELAQRVPYLIVILALIGVGVGTTLWLSAQSTQETYALRSAQEHNLLLEEQKVALEASIERSRSAEELAARAEKLGLHSVVSAPILARGADGEVEVIGQETPELGAPISPLQQAPVPSRPGGESGPPRDGQPPRFDTPPAQPAPDSAPVGADPRPGVEPRPDRDAPPPDVEPRLEPAPNPLAAGDGLQPMPGT